MPAEGMLWGRSTAPQALPCRISAGRATAGLSCAAPRRPLVLPALPTRAACLRAPLLPQLLSQVELHPTGSMRIVALRSGYLTPPPKELVRAPRKQVRGAAGPLGCCLPGVRLRGGGSLACLL